MALLGGDVLVNTDSTFGPQLLSFLTSLFHMVHYFQSNNQAIQDSPQHLKLHQLGYQSEHFLVYCNCKFYLPEEGVATVTVFWAPTLSFLLQLFLLTLRKSSGVLGLAPLLLTNPLRLLALVGVLLPCSGRDSLSSSTFLSWRLGGGDS